MESITNGGLWEVGFGKTPLCIHFSIILKQCITAMIKKTNKNWGQAMVNFHSSYDRLYPLVINPHHACSHWLTLLPRLTVVNDRFQNISDSLESGPDGAGWGEWKWGKCGEMSQWGITSQTALVSEGLTSPVPEIASLSSILINLAWSPLQLLNSSSTLEGRDASSGITQSLRGSPPSAQVEVSSPPLARRMKER